MLMERKEILEEATINERPVIGKHVYGELYDCDERILSDPEELANIVREAARIGRFTLLDIRTWKIHPGVSVVGIVLESHITIHTWPEHRFATVDVYTCGETGDPVAAYLYIVKRLKAKKYTMKTSNRSYEWV